MCLSNPSLFGNCRLQRRHAINLKSANFWSELKTGSSGSGSESSSSPYSAIRLDHFEPYKHNKSNEHVPVCYAADTIYLPYHMISEHLQNGDLLSYLKNRREQHPPSYREVLKICTASAKTMEFLHKNRVVHNHLCAEHLLVGETLTCIKITSFGRSRHATEKEFQEGYQGECISPLDPAIRWAAPEVLRQPPLFSSKSDVWAFGVLMYEIIMCGMVPYMNKDLKEVREDVS